MTDYSSPHWLEKAILSLPRDSGIISISREDFDAAPPDIREKIEAAVILTYIQKSAGITSEEVCEAISVLESWWPDDDGDTAMLVLVVLICKVGSKELSANGFRVVIGDRDLVCEIVAEYIARNPELRAIPELTKVASEIE